MSKKTKNVKNNLDERQEAALQKSESKGFWLAYWLLLIIMLAEMVVNATRFAKEIPLVAGEWIVFMILCVYMIVSCSKNNIWDRRLQPTFKTNFLISLLAGIVVGMVCFVMVYLASARIDISLIGAGIGFVATAVLCLLTLMIFASAYKKKKAKLEQQDNEE